MLKHEIPLILEQLNISEIEIMTHKKTGLPILRKNAGQSLRGDFGRVTQISVKITDENGKLKITERNSEHECPPLGFLSTRGKF